MRIELNGSPRELPGPATVGELLRGLGLDRSPCAVEVNSRLVRKPDHPPHALAEADPVELVTLVGGG